MILLTIFFALSLILAVASTYLLRKSLRLNSLYTEFYNSTLDDVEAVLESLEELMYRRQLLSDDPDIRRLHKAISVLYDILAEYANAEGGKRFIARGKETKEKQQ